MKVRQGFISNSSSASFIVTLNGAMPLYGKAIKALRDTGNLKNLKFPTPKQIAIEMLTAANGDGVNDERYTEALGCIDAIDDDVDFVAFPSINEETEIFKIEEGRILVRTCNNQWESWEYAIEKIKSKYPDAQVETFSEGDEPEEFHEDWDIWNNDADNKNNSYYLHFNYLKMKREEKKIFLLQEYNFYKKH